MDIKDAIKKIKEDTKNSKFDQTVELHINLGIDPNKADQAIRVSCTLPHGTGTSKKVLLVSNSVGALRAKPVKRVVTSNK